MMQSLFLTKANLMMPEEAGAYLSCVSILQTKNAEDAAKSLAIRQIMSQSDQNLAIYVMPQLVSMVFSASGDSRTDALQLLETLCERSPYARNLLDALDHVEAISAQLCTFAAEAAEVELNAEDYIDLSDRVDIIFSLSVLGALPDSDAEEVFAEEAVLLLLQNAMQGYFGRYALALAYEIAEAHRIPFQKFPKPIAACYAEPDLVAAFLRMEYAESTAQDMLKEVFQNPLTPAEKYQVQDLVNAVQEKPWFVQGADKPTRNNNKFFIDTMWISLMLRIAFQKAQREDTVPAFVATCCECWKTLRDQGKFSRYANVRSPWTNQKQPNEHIYRNLNDQIAAFFAVPLLQQMVAALPEDPAAIPDFLAELILNVTDIVSENGKPHGKKKKTKQTFSDAMAACHMAAYALSHELLKGYWNPALPKKCFQLVMEKTKPVLCGAETAYSRQELLLHSGAALILCIKEAYEEGSGMLPICGNARVWLLGGVESMAYQLCALAFSEYITYQQRQQQEHPESDTMLVHNTALALTYERFPELLEELNWELDTDWLDQFCQEKKKPEEYKLLLHCYSADDYAAAEIVVDYPMRADNARKLEMLCKKVAAIAEDSYNDQITPQNMEALYQFGNVLLSVYNKVDFPRRLRTIVTDTLETLMNSDFFRRMGASKKEDAVYSTNLNAQDLVQIAEEAVTDLSREAVYYQYRVAEKLLKMVNEELLPEGTQQFLVKCFFHILLHQQNLEDPRLKEMLPPFERQEILNADTSRNQLLIWFVAQLESSEKLSPFLWSLKGMLEEWRIRNEQYTKIRLTIEQSGVTCTAKNAEGRNFPIELWDPNTTNAWKLKSKPWQGVFWAELYDANTWQPMVRSFEEFIIENKKDKEPFFCYMTVVSMDETGALISARRGYNYRIPAEFFAAESWDRLCKEQERIAEELEDASITGLWLKAHLETQPQQMPQLVLDEVNDKNQRYANLFSETDSLSWDKTKKTMLLERGEFQVTAELIGPKSEDVRLRPNGWNLRQQRLRRLLVVKDETRSLRECKETRQLPQLLSLQTEQVIRLSQINYKKENQGSNYMAYTNFGMPVYLETDSFSLAAPEQNDVDRNPQYAVITMIPPQNRMANGVIWKYKIGADAVIRYQIGEDPVETMTIPTADLEISEKSIYCGLPVWVDPTQKTVHIAQRIRSVRNETAEKPSVAKLRVRRLWKLEESVKAGPAVCGVHQEYLGRYQLAGQEDPVYLVQDYRKGTLSAYTQEMEQPPQTICGVDLINGRAELFRTRQDENIIAFKQNNTVCYGFAKPTEGFTTKPVHCKKVSVNLIAYSCEGKTLYDVRRIFSKPERSERKPVPKPQFSDEVLQKQRKAKQYYDEYQSWQRSARWIIQDVRHAEGTAVRDADGSLWFEPESPLHAFPLQEAACSDTDIGQWVQRIPMQLERSFFAERQNHVFAKIELCADGSYVALPDESAALTLEHFADWMSRKYPNVREYLDPLRFVTLQTEEEPKTDAEPMTEAETGNENTAGKKQSGTILIFEYGFGMRVKIAESALELVGDRKLEPARFLFYGDRISPYRLLRDETNNSIRLVADLDALHLSIEHQVRNDANNGMVQYLTLHYNKEQDQILTEKITVRTGSLDAADPVRFKPYLTGALDEETTAYVKQQLADGGVGTLIVNPSGRFDKASNRLVYTRISLDQLDGRVLCMHGDTIQETYSGNDYLVRFTMPELIEAASLLDDAVKGFSVVVKRRGFSYRESTLRMQYRTGNQDIFHTDMLIRINSIEKNQFTIKGVPAHDLAHTKKWLEATGPQQVIIGTELKSGLVRCEVSPGVICLANPVRKEAHSYTEGSLGSIYLKNGEVCVEQISDDDSSFVKNGRPAELLIMDDAWNNRGETEVHFSVAGLPQVLAEGRELYQNTYWRNPPRYGVLYKDENGVVHAKTAPVPMGYLKTDAKGFIQQYDGNLVKQYSKFHTLSFLDGDLKRLSQHVRNASWHYHDKQTNVLHINEDPPVQVYTYPSGQDLPLLYGANGRLRYTEQEIANYAFPPHELEEYGIRNGTAEYPVAYGYDWGFYLELSPGRIAKINSSMLHVAGMRKECSMLKFDTRHLGTGDTVRIYAIAAKRGTPRSLVLESVHYGLRSYMLPDHNAYLPVAEVPYGTTLGNAMFSLEYPMAKKYAAGDLMLLDAGNALHPCKTLPQKDDLLMLHLDENGALCACGFPEMQVSISVQTADGTVRTNRLHQQLQDVQQRRELFAALGGMLPVRVASLEEGMLSVYYPSGHRPKPGTVFAAQILGIQGTYCMLLRAGTYLFTLNMAAVLGVSLSLAAAILREAFRLRIFAANQFLWMHAMWKNNKILFAPGWSETEKLTREVRLCFALDDETGRGFLCRDRNTGSYVWMPLSEVARTKKATAAMVYPILQQFSRQKPLTVRTMDRGTVSWLQGNAYLDAKYKRLERRNLDRPTVVVVASERIIETGADNAVLDAKYKSQEPQNPDQSTLVVASESTKATRDTYAYLCYERPVGNIYLLNSETIRKKGDIVYTVCQEKRLNNIELVAQSEYRTPLRVSQWLKDALHQSFSGGKICDRAILQAQYQPQEAMRDAFRTGIAAEDSETEVLILALCRQAIGQCDLDPDAEEAVLLEQQIKAVLQRYLEQHSLEEDVPVLTAVAITYLAERLHTDTNKNDYRALFDCLRYVENKNLCASESILLKEWLLQEPSHELYDLRRLLDQVQLDGKTEKGRNSEYAGRLSRVQLEQMDMVCGTILRRNKLQESDTVGTVAMALQYLVREKPSASEESLLRKAWENTKAYRLLDKLYHSIRKLEQEANLYESMLTDPCCCHLVLSQRNGSQFIKALRMLLHWSNRSTTEKADSQQLCS